MKEFNRTFFLEENFIKSIDEISYMQNVEGDPIYHICYNIDDNYFSILGASMVSVLENNLDMRIVFHIFTDGFSDENAEKIKEIALRWKCNCILYVFDMQPFADFHIKVDRFSRITYGRLYIPKVLKNITDRYLYIDADTLCVSSLKKIYSLDMAGNAIGAVSEDPDTVKYRSQFLNLSNGRYFNDGVMLVDIKQWEAKQITECSFSYQNEPKKRFLGQSQDVLNLVFDGEIFFLPAQYNAFGGGYKFLDGSDAVIVHWTGRRKPWQMVLTKFDKLWRKYNAMSPWDTITNIHPVKKPKNYHDFQQWGRFHKEQGNIKEYIYGIFWYAVLRFRYKTKL